MGLPTVAIVVTSVHDGGFLKHYAEACKDAYDRVTMYVIADRKTPLALYDEVENSKLDGLRIECPRLHEQAAFLAKLGAPEGMFGWDTDHRRNVGYLMAWESGADVMVSVDDDNLPGQEWLAEHAWAAEPETERRLVSSDSGFWNPCDLLVTSYRPMWPRGFPYGRRHPARHALSGRKCEVAINAGLWSGHPDVDAITRLAVGAESEALGTSLALAPDTWAPVNSQNTAIRREVIPAYYFFRSGRFGDIYQGYLAQACAKAVGHAVRFGTPVVTHERNDHDLLRDLELELPDILILDRWLDWLTVAKLPQGSYEGAYDELSQLLLEHAINGSYEERQRNVLLSMATQMAQWLVLIRRIGV